MERFYFFRENNNFDDILSDMNIKKDIRMKMTWHQHLILGIVNDESHGTYLTLKYGDDMKKPQYKDLTPIKGVDYSPKR